MTPPDNDNNQSDTGTYVFMYSLIAVAVLLLAFVQCHVEPANALPRAVNPVQVARCR